MIDPFGWLSSSSFRLDVALIFNMGESVYPSNAIEKYLILQAVYRHRSHDWDQIAKHLNNTKHPLLKEESYGSEVREITHYKLMITTCTWPYNCDNTCSGAKMSISR